MEDQIMQGLYCIIVRFSGRFRTVPLRMHPMHNWIRSAHTVKECNGKVVNVHKSNTNGSFSGGSGGWMTI